MPYLVLILATFVLVAVLALTYRVLREGADLLAWAAVLSSLAALTGVLLVKLV
jgi:hypothetical protein